MSQAVALFSAVWIQPSLVTSCNIANWEPLLGQLRRTRLTARLAVLLHDNDLMGAIPPRVKDHLDGALLLTDRQLNEVHWEVNRLSKALQGLDVPLVLLKGAAYVMAELSPARGRLFSDIDLLVPKQSIELVERSLLAAGWISDERDPYNQRYYREWMHEIPPLRHVQRNTYLDLHHTITPPTSRFDVDGSELLANAKALEQFPGLYTLSDSDMVLHSAVHLFTEGEFGTGYRDLLDMNDLIRCFQHENTFWPNLISRALKLKLQTPLYYALFEIERLFGTQVPPELTTIVKKMQPNWIARRFMAWALKLALKPQHPSADTRWTGLARWFLYVRSHAIRMPLYLMIPHLTRKAWMAKFPKASA